MPTRQQVQVVEHQRNEGKTKRAIQGLFTRKGLDAGKSLKPKDLMMMPARVAMALQADGVADGKAAEVLSRVISDIEDSYDEEPIPDKVQVVLERLWAEYVEARGDSWWLRSEIVWHKPNPMPESVTDRPTSSHEKVFLMTKKPRYFYDADAVRVAIDANRGAAKGRKHAVIWRRGQRHGTRKSEMRENPASKSHPSGANLRNVWKIPTHSLSRRPFRYVPARAGEALHPGRDVGGRRLRGLRRAVGEAGGEGNWRRIGRGSNPED